MSGNYRRIAIGLNKMRKENKHLVTMLEACHEANLARMKALRDAGIADPISDEEE